MNATITAQAAPAFKPLDFIDLEDETGRTSALAINGRKPDAQGWLRVTGGLPHGLGFKPKDEAARDKLMEWLCPGSVKAVNSHTSLLTERDALRAALQDTESALSGLFHSELSIDHDHNRTPQRLAIRDSVWAYIDKARALLNLSTPPALRDGQE